MLCVLILFVLVGETMKTTSNKPVSKDLQDQVKKIRNIMGLPSDIPDYRFTFGKYKGKLLASVVDLDPNYLLWLVNEVEEGYLPEKVDDYLLKFQKEKTRYRRPSHGHRNFQ